MTSASGAGMLGETLRASTAYPAQSVGEVDARARTRVLVVDDDRRNLLALSEVLEDIADVVQANSGEEALRYLLKDEFAVIILDVLMPGLDGYETAALVRAREQSRNTPIIFLSAINKEDVHLLRGYDSGAVDYVFKPFEPTILRSKVSVFVRLFEKTREVEERSAREQKLLEDALRAQRDKQRSDEALRDAEDLQGLILSSLPLAVYVQPGDGSEARRFVAGDLLSLTGFETSETSGADFFRSRVHPDDLDVFSEAADPGAGSDNQVEYRWLHADGSYRHFVDHAIRLRDPGGLIAGTLRDTTERRQLQDQLLQSQKLDAVGKLTGGIAHDFNNLLASVLSGLSLIERRATLDERSKQVVQMTRHAAQQGSLLVNRMLTFSRRQNLKPEVIDLAAISRTLHEMLSPVLGGLIRLDWQIDAAAWPTFVDASQLELAIMNLVFNARDAMPSGGSITISIGNRRLSQRTRDLEAGDFVVVTVADTGMGIGPELLSKVLEPFFTTKDVGKGTGLGLSTAYGFAKQSGGALHIESTVGRGTSVEVWLPRTASQMEQGVPADPLFDGQEIVSVPSNSTVLLVDDSATLRELTRMQLTDAGYDVVSAAGGAEALAMIEREPDRFDLIVTDYAMPLISGVEVIRFARNLRADWPAVIITGYADAEEISARPGDVPLVIKPFQRRTLLEAMRRARGNAGSPVIVEAIAGGI